MKNVFSMNILINNICQKMEFILIFVLFMCRLAKYFSDYFFVIRQCYNIRSCQKVVYYGHMSPEGQRCTMTPGQSIPERLGKIGVMLERSRESQVVTQSPKNRITIHYKRRSQSVRLVVVAVVFVVDYSESNCSSRICH